jgi:6-phosphogluconolactonase
MNRLRKMFLVSLLLSLCSFALPAWANYYSVGKVFTMTNAAEGNEILIFSHHPYQGLIETGSVKTGGKGSGGGLGNQGGLVLSKNHRWLFAVNAGSNSISVFRVQKRGLLLVDTVSSDGEQPVSLTVHRDLLYVLNAASDSIAGFSIDYNGKLLPLEGSVRNLSGAGTAPAQISFTPWGDTLVVTEKATNLITTFVLDESDLPGPAIVNNSAGETPFGFAFDRYGHLLVSEAAGGADDASSVSSYNIMEDGKLVVIASEVPTTETAACWLVTSRNGRFAFTTNTGSSSISAFKIRRDGNLKLTTKDGVAADTGLGSAPIDLALSRNGRYLFALSAINGTIVAYRVTHNSRLSPLPGISGLPLTINGLAAF